MSIRVLHCIHSLQGGGAETQVKILTSYTAKNDIVSAIFCINDSGKEDIFDKNVVIYKHKLKAKFDPSVLFSIKTVIKEFQPDLVHVWLPASVTIPAMIAAKISGVQCVFSYRNLMRFHRVLSIPEYLVAKICTNKVISNNHITQSKYLFREMYASKNGCEIKNAVIVDKSVMKQMDECYSGGKLRLLFVGRLTHQKNAIVLLQALSRLSPNIDYLLTICGEGEDRPLLEAEVNRLGLQNNVVMVGYRKDVHLFMKKSHVLILPSLHEGMPNVLLEALAIGLPSIVSNIPAHDDLIDNSGAVEMFNPNEPGELANLIEHYHDNYSIENNKVTLGKEIASKYSPEILADNYNKAYRDLLGLS